jgi:amino acid adenylation domain-containing protein/non-ribosomal peptide synthase protein (TIGR01720 family)
MDQARVMRCSLVGTGSLVIQCGDELRACGHDVVGVASPDPKVASWAAAAGIRRAADLASLKSALGGSPIDLLFSVVNDDILPADTISWPSLMAINYHDGPLPRYAGIHATSWALMAGEQRHAVSWHVMSDRVDAGDILAQEFFDISPDDSAFTLNARAYEAALKSFKALVTGLESGASRRKPQDESARTFFGRHKRPPNAGILDWTSTVRDQVNLGRALDFGPYENPLGVVRIWTGTRFLTASSISPQQTGPNQLPGTVINSGTDWIRIAAGDGDVRLNGVRAIDGSAIDPSADPRFHCARRLPPLPADQRDGLLALDQEAKRRERFWVRRLASLEPVVLPHAGACAGSGETVVALAAAPIPGPGGVSRAEYLTGAWAAFLSRLSRSSRFDLLFRGPGQPAVDGPIGALFAPAIPLRVDIDLARPMPEVAGTVAADLRLIHTNRTFARDVAVRYPALRQVAELKDAHAWQAGVICGQRPDGAPLAAATLHIPDAGSPSLICRNDRLTPEAAAALADQFGTFLASVARDPSQPADAADMVPAAERRRVIETFNSTDRPYERGVTLVALMERHLKAHPQREAVRFEGKSVDYAGLHAMASRLAHKLRALGVKPGMLVGVCLERSVELVAALVGVVKSGGAYVPLDPTYPIERLRQMASDAALAVVVTRDGELKKVGGWSGLTVVRMDDGSLDAQPATEPAPVATEIDPAYAIFTSGSTGRPKGGLNAHKGIVNRLLWMQEAYGLTEADRVLQKTPYSFDVSVWEFFWPLITGATIVVAKPEGHRDSAYLVSLIAKEGVTVLHFVPSMLRVFVEERGLEICKSLRRVVCSGEALPYELTERFFARIPQAKLANLYGPTEAAVDVTFWECKAKDERGIVPIGFPIANTAIYILDPKMQPVPVGVSGELFIGGIQVGMGYVNRPELTAERFIADPFRAGGRLYKTGDLARWLSDGTVEYLGRLDDQVKIRGFRIELGEIEAVLAEQPGVKEAVVIAREDVPGSKRIVAYAVGAGLSVQTLKESLGKKLPEFMVPSAIVFLEAIPVTANGKLDRRALPEPPREGGAGKDRTPPATPAEETLAVIWKEMLKLEAIGVLDNFFEIGGDSILGLRIVAKARDAGLEFAVHDLFRNPTIRTLAAQVAAAPTAKAERTRPFQLCSEADRKRLPAGVVDAYPLSALQGGMVFHSERRIGSYLYQVAMSLHVKAKLDMTVMQKAVDRVVARHPILRTSFDLAGFSEPLQLVYGDAKTKIQYHDISGLPTARQNELLAKWIDDEAEYQFDWQKPPLLTYTVHKRGPDNFQFGITFHDAILDGWSTSNMMTEIFERYLAMMAGGADVADPPNSITYRDFVALERSTLASEDAKKFWNGLLADAPFTAVPRVPGVGRDVAVPRNLDLIVPVPADVNAKVEERARELAIPVKSFYLAVHNRVLGMMARQDEVVTGLVMNGRIEEPGGDRSLGNHLNTMPYRLHVGGKTWAELGKDAHEAELKALPHRRYIGAQLLRDLGRAGQDNLFETGFNYTHFHVYHRLANRDDFKLLRADFTDPFHYVLVANFRVDAFDGRLDIVLNYNTKHVTLDQCKRIGRYYVNALRTIARDPAEKADTRSMLPESEREQVVRGFNSTARPYERGVTLPTLIERKVKESPSRTAVRFDGKATSYGDLNAMANRLAHRLKTAGVKPGTPVGVCLERSVELVAALVGAVKAGGAYVPLDPGYPTDRLGAMVADSGLKVIVTRKAEQAKLNLKADLVVFMDDGSLASQPAENPAPVATEEDPAYIIFTSGSTGRPKGAANSHKGIVNRLFWMQEAYSLSDADRVLQKTPYSFDVSVWEFFWPLITGAAIVVAKPGGHRDSAYMADLIAREGVTVTHFVPPMLRVFLDERGAERCTTLRRIVCSGEALPFDLTDRLFNRMPWAKLANLYGPTEAAVDVTAWECKRGDPRGIVPIGAPIANTQIYILDGDGQPVPPLVPGELFIAGIQVGMGYINRPELTAERFVANPFTPGEKMYRTGDLARWLTDGTVEYLGRLDDQVKIRGFRIELGEIESVLAAQKGVKEAVVLAREDVPGVKRLVAYIVGAGLGAPMLKDALASKLPEYMVPSAFVFLDALPVTSNGKLDRRALPEPPRAAESAELPADQAPTSDVEQVLAAVWRDVLRLDRVGIHDNFFEIGGDSILSIQICARARRKGVVLTPDQIFDHPTIAELAPLAGAAAAVEAEQGVVESDATILPIQQWLLDQSLVNPNHWNAAIMLEVPKGLEPMALERALRALVVHHDALRLRFTRDGKAWKQRNAGLDADGLRFTTVEIERFGTPQADAQIESDGGRLQKSLDLAKGPLFAATLFREKSEGRARLLMVAHHLVLDGLSWRIIIEDLIAAYDQAHRGLPVTLQPKTASFRAWGEALSRHARTLAGSNEAEWWSMNDNGPEIPLDTPGAANIESSARVITVALDPERTTALLHEAPAAYGTLINDVLLAALALAARDWTGESALRLDLMGHGRETVGEDIDVSRTVGWFTSLFPVALDVGRAQSPDAALPLVRDQLRRIPGRGLGYGLLRYLATDTEAGKSLHGTPGPRLSFNYLGQFDQALAPGWSLRVARTRCGPTRDPASPRAYALEVDAMVVDGRLTVDWTFGSGLFREDSIRSVAEGFIAWLGRIIEGASKREAAAETDYSLSGLSDAGLAKLSALFDSSEPADD